MHCMIFIYHFKVVAIEKKMVVYDFNYTLQFKSLGLVRSLFKVSHAHNLNINTQTNFVKYLLQFKINIF